MPRKNSNRHVHTFSGNSHRIDLDAGFRRQYHPRISVSDQFMLIPSTYDYEVRESLNTTASDFYLHNCIASQDTLYHYDIDSNTLHPVFTMHTGHEPICHYFTELPNHFLVTWYTQTSWNNELPRFPKILVDKQSLKGCFVNLKWNMLGI